MEKSSSFPKKRNIEEHEIEDGTINSVQTGFIFIME